MFLALTLLHMGATMQASIKLTRTMLDKAIIDANTSVREFAWLVGVDFADMVSGDRHQLAAFFSDGTETVINLYRTNNARADRRISIKGIKKQFKAGDTLTIDFINNQILIRG